jgi:hypothetical protein
MPDNLPVSNNDNSNVNSAQSSGATVNSGVSNTLNNPQSSEPATSSIAPKRTFRPINLSLIAVLVAVVGVTAGSLFYLRYTTIGTSPEVFVADVEGEGYGFTGIRGVAHDDYDAPLWPVPNEYRSNADSSRTKAYDASDFRRQMGEDRFCNIDDITCQGWAWKYVCDVDPSVVWDNDGSWPTNRKCEKRSNNTDGVTFESLIGPVDGENTVHSIDNVGCGKLVQIDLTEGNAEPGSGPDSQGDDAHIYDYLIFYTGTCSEEPVCLTQDWYGELTSGWEECNYCVDENSDGIYDPSEGTSSTVTCNAREEVCRQKSVDRFNSIAPRYPDKFGDISVPSYDVTDHSTESKIAWFNFGYKVVVEAPTNQDEGHILSEGTACGMGFECCLPPVIPTPTPTPNVTPTPTPTPPQSYLSCVNEQCVEVVGEGQDECTNDAQCVVPTPEQATIVCDSLTGVAVGSGGEEYAVNSIPNDFVGSLVLTCAGRSSVKPINSIEFNLVKTLDGLNYKDTKVLDSTQITQVSNVDGVMTYRGSATFSITGQGDYSATSKVCNEDNLCSQ